MAGNTIFGSSIAETVRLFILTTSMDVTPK
jgi:hypothetical protein